MCAASGPGMVGTIVATTPWRPLGSTPSASPRSRDAGAGALPLTTTPGEAMYESEQQQAVWAYPRRVCLFPTACDGNRGGYPCLPAPYPWRVDGRSPSADAGFWV